MPAYGVLVIGPSGTGKSFSVKKLDKLSTLIINIQGKALPFKGRKGFANTFTVDTFGEIMDMLVQASEDPGIKTIVIDDFQYYLLNMFANKYQEPGYEKYAEMGVSAQQILNAVKLLRDDQFVFFLNHDDVDDNGNIGVKIPCGKFVKEKVVPEGMFTMVLRSCINEDKYMFQTQNLGKDVCKSPEDMFPGMFIPNDLQLIIDSVNAYDNDEAMPTIGEATETMASKTSKAKVQPKVKPKTTSTTQPAGQTFQPQNQQNQQPQQDQQQTQTTQAPAKKPGLMGRMNNQQKELNQDTAATTAEVNQAQQSQQNQQQEQQHQNSQLALTREDKVSSICAIFGTKDAALRFMVGRGVCQTSFDEITDVVLGNIYENRTKFTQADIASVQ